jgi:hypothetical protein
MPRIDPPVCSNGCCRDAVHRRHYRPPEIVRRIRLVISAESRVSRQRAAVQALLATLIKPEGAQGNTQSPPYSGVLRSHHDVNVLPAGTDAQPCIGWLPGSSSVYCGDPEPNDSRRSGQPVFRQSCERHRTARDDSSEL